MIRTRFAVVVGVSLGVIALSALAGIGLGSHPIPAATVVEALIDYDPANNDHIVVVQSRVPRVVMGIVVGAALGLAGALMQSFTRNPLADPGILGVNAGASAAVVVAIAYFGVTDVGGYVWFAFIGAAAGTVAVYLLGSAHRSTATPARMALAGTALSMVISAFTGMVLLSNEPVFLQFRYWTVGTLQGRGIPVLRAVLPFMVAGAVLAALLARPLNAIALGEQTARGLGVNARLVRLGTTLAVVLLAGGATAAAGPISFVGLAAPHVVRILVGPDHRLLLPGVLVVAPATLLAADTVGRIAVAPGELQTGISAAVLGGPIFVALARSRKLASL
ncbi:iron chelate uptake ABC transporter family permease subunit [Brooklawnia cerclae]|uniref:Iron complex transport system permease protein n=1 Tax=Brooklawnia cerclae TaxID=349934 RepID=A0ABX0SJG7_9ACTN|nr:iron complex transport system permease protein [Brooklawnia cerclae]